MNELEIHTEAPTDCQLWIILQWNGNNYKLLLREDRQFWLCWRPHEPHPSESDYQSKLQEIWFMQFTTRISRAVELGGKYWLLFPCWSFYVLDFLNLYTISLISPKLSACDQSQSLAPWSFYRREPIFSLTSNFRFLCGMDWGVIKLIIVGI